MMRASQGRTGKWNALAAGPAILWLVVFVALPFLGLAVVSFLSRGDYGNLELPWTIENYQRLSGFGLFGFEPLYPVILARSLLLALLTAALCAAAGIPLAYYVARLSPRSRLTALILLTVPIWTNLLVRTYAWQIVLGPQSWLSAIVSRLGLLPPETGLYPGLGAVLIGLVCDYLPFAALPIYASVERIDRALIEAGRDLGARGWQLFRHTVYPQIKAGIWAGFALVFLPAMGQFVIPDLLGGGKTVLLGNLLQQQFGASRDWPFGAAIASVTLLLVMAGTWLLSRSARSKDLP